MSYFPCLEGSGRPNVSYFAGAGRLREAHLYVFYVSGRFWEAQCVVFYVSGRLWEAKCVIFYVCWEALGGSICRI